MRSRCEFQTPGDREGNGLWWRLGVLERQVGGDVKLLSTSALTDEKAEVWRWEIIEIIQQVIDTARPGARPLDQKSEKKSASQNGIGVQGPLCWNLHSPQLIKDSEDSQWSLLDVVVKIQKDP